MLPTFVDKDMSMTRPKGIHESNLKIYTISKYDNSWIEHKKFWNPLICMIENKLFRYQQYSLLIEVILMDAKKGFQRESSGTFQVGCSSNRFEISSSQNPYLDF